MEALEGKAIPDRARLEEAVRWHFLRYFTATDASDLLIRQIWPDIDDKSHEYTLAEQDIGSWTRN